MGAGGSWPQVTAGARRSRRKDQRRGVIGVYPEGPNPPAPFPKREGGEDSRKKGRAVAVVFYCPLPPSPLREGAGGVRFPPPPTHTPRPPPPARPTVAPASRRPPAPAGGPRPSGK